LLLLEDEERKKKKRHQNMKFLHFRRIRHQLHQLLVALHQVRVQLLHGCNFSLSIIHFDGVSL